jgi:Icc-related predicted phosphoesterase
MSDEESKFLWNYFVPEKFKDIDFVISCGDLKSEYLSFLATMMSVPIFYIPGNHDGKYDMKPPEGCICIDNKIIKYRGIRIMGLGGSHKYNEGPYQYTEKQMLERYSKLMYKIWWNRGVDMLITHAPAYGQGDGKDVCHKGFKVFNRIMDKHLPKYFIHGHQHLNYGKTERLRTYKETTIINAYDHFVFEY